MHAILAQNRGCILLGSHLGSFEVLRAQGIFDHKLPITVIMHEAAASNLNAVLHNLRPEIRDRIIPRNRRHDAGGRGTIRSGGNRGDSRGPPVQR
ncbi:MAG: hypothetical protein QM771_00600 [Nitrospira sp.]